MLGEPIIFTGGSAALDKQDKKQLRAIARQAKASNERRPRTFPSEAFGCGTATGAPEASMEPVETPTSLTL